MRFSLSIAISISINNLNQYQRKRKTNKAKITHPIQYRRRRKSCLGAGKKAMFLRWDWWDLDDVLIIAHLKVIYSGFVVFFLLLIHSLASIGIGQWQRILNSQYAIVLQIDDQWINGIVIYLIDNIFFCDKSFNALFHRWIQYIQCSIICEWKNSLRRSNLTTLIEIHDFNPTAQVIIKWSN